MIEVTAITGREAHAWLREGWEDLYICDPRATPFQSPGWINGWAGQLPQDTTPLLLTAREHGRLSAVLALAEHRTAQGPTTVGGIGAPQGTYLRPVGPGSEDQGTAEAFAQSLTRLAQTGARIELSSIPAHHPLGEALVRCPGWRHTRSRTAVLSLPLQTDQLNRTARRLHARNERLLALTGGQITYRRTLDTDELLAQSSVLDTLASPAGAPAPSKPLVCQSWQEVLRSMGPMAFIAAVEIDGEPMAMALCLTRGLFCYVVRTAIDPALEGLAPEQALVRRLAGSLAGEGNAQLDLGPHPDTPHHRTATQPFAPTWVTVISSVCGQRQPQPPARPSHPVPRRRDLVHANRLAAP